jgi:RimJ/RimL family protein N-acetyltransferase
VSDRSAITNENGRDMSIPEIETERLRLRALRADDFEAYAEIMADPEVTRFLADGRPLSRVDAWRQLAMILGHWELKGFGLWAVEEKGSGRLLGRIGCFEPEGWPAFEIAYTLGQHAWGRGYASEGAAAALDWSRTVLGQRDVCSVIKTGNVRSERVATKLGARLVETVPFYESTAGIWRYGKG